MNLDEICTKAIEKYNRNIPDYALPLTLKEFKRQLKLTEEDNTIILEGFQLNKSKLANLPVNESDLINELSNVLSFLTKHIELYRDGYAGSVFIGDSIVTITSLRFKILYRYDDNTVSNSHKLSQVKRLYTAFKQLIGEDLVYNEEEYSAEKISSTTKNIANRLESIVFRLGQINFSDIIEVIIENTEYLALKYFESYAVLEKKSLKLITDSSIKAKITSKIGLLGGD